MIAVIKHYRVTSDFNQFRETELILRHDVSIRHDFEKVSLRKLSYDWEKDVNRCLSHLGNDRHCTIYLRFFCKIFSNCTQLDSENWSLLQQCWVSNLLHWHNHECGNGRTDVSCHCTNDFVQWYWFQVFLIIVKQGYAGCNWLALGPKIKDAHRFRILKSYLRIHVCTNFAVHAVVHVCAHFSRDFYCSGTCLWSNNLCLF